MRRSLRFFVAIVLVLFTSFIQAAESEDEKRRIHYMSTGEDPHVFVQKQIDTHDVVVFARSYGPHNAEARKILKEMQEEIDVHVEVIEVDLLPGWDGSLIMHELQEVTGQWAFPNIFIGKKHIGGNSELEQHSALGELEGMLKEASSKEL